MGLICIFNFSIKIHDLEDWTRYGVVAKDISSGKTFSRIDFDDFESSNFAAKNQEQSIIINLRLKEKVRHTFPTIDRCCRLDGRILKYDHFDNMIRMPCNISSEDFQRDYIDKREPVILTGCQENWKAKKWTFRGILGPKIPTLLTL